MKWEDPLAVLEWVKKYRSEVMKPLELVETFGAKFTFLAREDAVNSLWNGSEINPNGVLKRFYCFCNKHGDRNLHPIPFLGCGPGTGKCRLLQEIHNVLYKKAQETKDGEIISIFKDAVYLNVTYGNGSAAEESDKEIGGEASLAIRIFYSYFIHGNEKVDYSVFRSRITNENVKSLNLSHVLQAIYKDKVKEDNRKLAIVIGIDEVNKLNETSNDAFRTLVNSIGSRSCLSGKVFFVPILAGTIIGPLRSIITKSMHQALHLPLHLLDDSDMLKIACDIGFDEKYVYNNSLFRRIVADIGGQVRALELFYEMISKETSKMELEAIDLTHLMHLVGEKLQDRYCFDTYADQMTPILANAILGKSVNKKDGFLINGQQITYEDLKSHGILMLEPVGSEFNICIPYLWVWLLIKAASDRSLFKFWNLMINPKEQFYWKQWEKFNVEFWALRICLFSALGNRTLKLKELLNGALCSNSFMDEDVEIPDYNSVKIHYLRNQYPSNGTIYDHNNSICEISYFDNYTVYLNADGAACDGFTFLIINDEQKKESKLLALQTKWRNMESNNPQKISDKVIKEEYKKVKEVAENIGINNWLLLVLSNCECSINSENLQPECVIVSKDNFAKFYGNVYSSRAQFAASKVYNNSKNFSLSFLNLFTKKNPFLQVMIKSVLIQQNSGN